MKKLFVVLFASVLIGVGGERADAVPLQALFDGAVLVADDKIFFDWTLINLVATDVSPDLGLIEVIPLEDQPRNPGIRFEANDQLVVRGENFLDLHFSFWVAVLDLEHLIKDNSLEIVAFEFEGDGGVITIFETVFDAGGNRLADKFVQADQLFGIFDLFDSAEFDPQALIRVEKNILIAGDFPGDVVSLDVFEQRFSQVPAPSALLLGLVGLAALAWLRRRPPAN